MSAQLSTFHIGRYQFGIDVALVQEISGLNNLRGEVLTAVDLRTRLGLPPPGDGHDPVNVVIRLDDEPVSLLVDEIGGVIEVSAIPFETTPSTVDAAVRDLLVGAYTLPDRLLLALNARKILALPAGIRA